MHYKGFLILIFLISSGLKSEIVVDPGEMVAIKISTCPDIKNKEFAGLSPAKSHKPGQVSCP